MNSSVVFASGLCAVCGGWVLSKPGSAEQQLSAENLLTDGLCSCEVSPNINVHYNMTKPSTSKVSSPSLNADGYDGSSQASQTSTVSSAEGPILRNLLSKQSEVGVNAGHSSLKSKEEIFAELEQYLVDASKEPRPQTSATNAIIRPPSLEDLASLVAFEPMSPILFSLVRDSDQVFSAPREDGGDSASARVDDGVEGNVAALVEQIGVMPNLPGDAVAAPPQANIDDNREEDSRNGGVEAMPAASCNQPPQEAAEDMVWEDLPAGALVALERVEAAEERTRLEEFIREVLAQITNYLREDVEIDLQMRRIMLETPVNGRLLQELEQRRIRLAQFRSEIWVALEHYQNELQELP